MAVSLRLQRHGKKKRPFYRVVAADSRHPRDGRYTESLGSYDPNHDPIVVELDMERVEHWLSIGATPSDTVRNIIDKVKAEQTVTPAQMQEANKKAKEERRRAAAARTVAKEVRAEDQKVEEQAKSAEAADAAEGAVEPEAKAPEKAESESAPAQEPEVAAEDAVEEKPEG